MSALPGRLRAVVCKGMEQVQAVLMEARRAEAVVPGHRFNTLGAHAHFPLFCSSSWMHPALCSCTPLLLYVPDINSMQ